MTLEDRDLSRAVLLDCSANGAVFIREQGQPLREGTLPFFSTDTVEEAETLRRSHCRLSRERGVKVYFLNNWIGEALDSLYAAADEFRASYAELKR